MGVWFIGGCCTGLRVEEMKLIENAGTKSSLVFLVDKDQPHFEFVISGRTKGDQLGGSKCAVPMVPVTQGNSLQPAKWIKRLFKEKEVLGLKHKRLFTRTKGKEFADLKLYERDFMDYLMRVQATTNPIDKNLDVRESY